MYWENVQTNLELNGLVSSMSDASARGIGPVAFLSDAHSEETVEIEIGSV